MKIFDSANLKYAKAGFEYAHQLQHAFPLESQ